MSHLTSTSGPQSTCKTYRSTVIFLIALRPFIMMWIILPITSIFWSCPLSLIPKIPSKMWGKCPNKQNFYDRLFPWMDLDGCHCFKQKFPRYCSQEVKLCIRICIIIKGAQNTQFLSVAKNIRYKYLVSGNRPIDNFEILPSCPTLNVWQYWLIPQH